MTSKRLFYILVTILVLLSAGAVGGTVLGNAFLQRETRNILDLKVESLALDEQQRSLVQAKRDITKYSDLERIAKSVVPQEKDQARTVREIVKIAADSAVPIANISFPASTLGQPGTKAAPTPATGTAATQPGSTTQVKPVEGIAGVYQLEINIQSAGATPVRYENMINFLSRLQQNRRTAHITSLTVTPSVNDRNRVTFTLTINAYIKP